MGAGQPELLSWGWGSSPDSIEGLHGAALPGSACAAPSPPPRGSAGVLAPGLLRAAGLGALLLLLLLRLGGQGEQSGERVSCWKARNRVLPCSTS